VIGWDALMKHPDRMGRDALMKHPGRFDGVTAGAGNALAEGLDKRNGEKNGNMAEK
jgi:hypothetical protein